MKCRTLVLTTVVLMSLAGRMTAQEPEYVDNLRFVHELRQRGDTDLAIDLLNRLAASGSIELRKVLPYELALCSKAEAVNEPDSGKRLQLYAKARADLIKFRDSNPNDERLAEIKIDIAEITVLEGKTEISRAMARDGIAAQSAGLLEARKKFESAAGELKSINDELEAKLAPLSDPKTPAERTQRAKLAKTHLRAELSVALNLFDVAQSYHRDGTSEVLRERAGKVEEAVKALQKVASDEDTYSESWQARAWLGRCEQELGEPKKARERFIPIIAARNPIAADGARLARYFRLLVIQEQLKSGGAEKDESIDSLIDGGRRWLRDYPRSLATPEGYGIRFLLADSLLQAAGAEKLAAAKKKEYQNEARKLTSDLAETENEYTDRARRMKIILIRQEGGFSKAVDDLKTFDECYVRAQYEIMEMGEDAAKIKDPKEREAKRLKRVETLLAALKRGLTIPGKNGNDANNARAMLTYYNLAGGKFNEAIRIGRKFAEESRSGPASLAAAYTLQAYGASIAQREDVLKNARAGEFTDDQGGKTDEATYRKLLDAQRAEMQAFSSFCEKTWPKELAGNLARHQLGIMNLRNEKIADALQILSTVTPEYPSYTTIQYLIGDISLKADLDKINPMIPYRERGLAALRNIPAPTGADPEQNRLYYQAKSRLGLELYRDKKFTEMEALAAPLLPKVATTLFHADPKVNVTLRDHFRTQLLKVQLFAKVGQADADFKANAMKKVADLVDPLLKDLKADTMQVPKNDPLVTQSLQALLSMALQANIQLGDLDRVKAIVAVYGKAIGEDSATVAVPEILKRLVPIIRTQVKGLKAKGDFAAVDRASKAFTGILDDLKQNQKKIAPEFLLILAQCYGSMDKTDKAIAVLEAIPIPKAGDVEGERVYQASRLAYLRQLRQVAANDPKKKAEIFKKASALLNEWMGTKDKPGWAAKMIDAHKERLYLYEMDDDTGAGFNKAQALVKALSAKITDPRDQVAKDQYLECYYYMVYFLYANGKKSTSPSTREQRTAEAASRIVALEDQYKDFGTDEMKKKFTDLMRAENSLRAAYEKAKKK